MTTARSPRSVRSRLAISTILVFAALAALTTAAEARWIRGLSDVSTYGDDISVCADEITIGFELVHQFDSFDSQYPSFGFGVGDPYPGLNPQNVKLFGTAADAIARTNELLTFPITIGYTGISGGGYQFLGQETLATPAGYENGDTLYAYSFDFDILQVVAVPLTIGDSVYDCPPEDLPWGVLGGKSRAVNEVKVNAFLPHTILFDASSVDPTTLAVTADGAGPAAKVTYLGSFGTIGVATVDLGDTGLDCGTESLLLAGFDGGGYAYEDLIKVLPVGNTCPR